MSKRAVEKHISSLFQKLGLADESDVNRRVMAVLAFLDATRGPAGRWTSADGGSTAPIRADSTMPPRRAVPVMMAPGGGPVADVRVLIVDDQEPFRRAIAAVVSETDGFVVVASSLVRRGVVAHRRAASAGPGADGRQPARHRRNRGHPADHPGRRSAGRRTALDLRPRTSSTSPAVEPLRTSPRPRSARTGSPPGDGLARPIDRHADRQQTGTSIAATAPPAASTRSTIACTSIWSRARPRTCTTRSAATIRRSIRAAADPARTASTQQK